MVAFAFTTNTCGELIPMFEGLEIKCACTGEMADKTKVWTIKGNNNSWFSLHYIKWGGKRYYYFLLEGVK